MHSSSVLAFVALVAAASASTVAAHGYLSSPPPRGFQKASYQIDDLKSPNRKGLCRGEPEGQITQVSPGQKLTLGLTITAPHTGPCRVTMLDRDLKNEVPVAEKYDCAAPGKAGPWTIQLPSGVSGRKVLRWYWEGRHVSPAEPYEQCIDLDFSGSGDSYDDKPTFGRKHDDDHHDGHDDHGKHDDEHGQGRRQHARPQVKTAGTPSPSSPATPSSHPLPTPTAFAPVTVPNGAGGEEPRAAPLVDAVANVARAGSGACSAGSYKCNADGGFTQCANGKWVTMGCAPGTACRQTSDTAIVCDRTAGGSAPVTAASAPVEQAADESDTGLGQPLTQSAPQEGKAAEPESDE
jgi:hypothetical protein